MTTGERLSFFSLAHCRVIYCRYANRDTKIGRFREKLGWFFDVDSSVSTVIGNVAAG